MPQKQEELRRLMREKTGNVGSAQSSYAKVLSTGKLVCTICPGVTVKSWTTHQISAQHKRSLAAQKVTKDAPEQSISRPASTKQSDLQNHAPKSILKNPLTSSSISSKKQTFNESSPPDFESAPVKRAASPNEDEPDPKNSKVSAEVSALPEGFFDDPKLDAKARNIEYKDPQEVEWELFQRALREEDNKSEQVVEIDEEKEMRERELYETDQMISNWEKVRELEIRKDQLTKVAEGEGDSDMDEDDETAFDEFLNWRQKAVR